MHGQLLLVSAEEADLARLAAIEQLLHEHGSDGTARTRYCNIHSIIVFAKPVIILIRLVS